MLMDTAVQEKHMLTDCTLREAPAPGMLPASWSTLRKLTLLSVAHNRLTGEVTPHRIYLLAQDVALSKSDALASCSADKGSLETQGASLPAGLA